MKPNAVRGAVAIVFVIAVIGAYLLGRKVGEQEATGGEGSQIRARGPGAGGSLAGLSGGIDRRRAAADGQQRDAEGKVNVRSVIAKARVKMAGGMMNATGMMRALALLDAIGDDQIQEALEEVERSVREPQQKMMFAMMLLGRWAESDGPAALAYAEEHFGAKKNPMMQQVKMSVVSSWAQGDPEGAWEWYQEQEDDLNPMMFGGKSMALIGIISSPRAEGRRSRVRTHRLDRTTPGAPDRAAGARAGDLERQQPARRSWRKSPRWTIRRRSCRRATRW